MLKITGLPKFTEWIAYRAMGRIQIDGTSRQVKDQFVSPASLFDTIDRPWWSLLREAGVFEGELEVEARYSSWLKWAGSHGEGWNPASGGPYGEGRTVGFPSLEERQALRRAFLQRRLSLATKLDFIRQTETPEWRLLREAMSGRLLLLDEVRQALDDLFQDNLVRNSTLETLQLGFLQGFFNWQPSVLPVRSGWFTRFLDGEAKRYQCGRCGSTEVVPVRCERCGQDDCAYCPHCLALGRVTACQPMLSWARWDEHEHLTASAVSTTKPQWKGPQWAGTLSPWQAKAAEALVHFIQQGRKRRFLVWAVCGAGKTEMLFEMLSMVLQEGKRVLFTAPRRDVILELAPRLREAFPSVSLSVLYGGSGDRFKPAQLVLATTHQVLRFKCCFDLIVIDEEDAYPFHHDPMLPLAVERAKAPDARLVFLTATPRPELKDRAVRGELDYVRVPRRFHGQPLAVPRIRPVGRWRKKMEQGEVITPLMDYTLRLMTKGRYGYLFVPHVRDIDRVKEYVTGVLLPYLKKQLSEGKIRLQAGQNGELFPIRAFEVEGVYAEHPERDAIVRRFREHRIRLLITTTILERGVTIPFSDVAVLGSDDPVFDSASLIQIAGRVGRKAEDPIGVVWFLPEMRTRAQVAAIREIKAWNRER
jgi:competence protein ComFA